MCRGDVPDAKRSVQTIAEAALGKAEVSATDNATKAAVQIHLIDHLLLMVFSPRIRPNTWL